MIRLLGLVLFLCLGLFCSASDSDLEGRECQLKSDNSSVGHCVQREACPYISCTTSSSIERRSCAADIVCCNKNFSLSGKACEDEQKYRVQHHVRNGEDVRSEQYPYLAALGFVRETISGAITPVTWVCSGVLLSRKFVLTAAHCATDPNNGVLSKVMVRDVNTSRTYSVDEIYEHEEFRPPAKYHDIALVKLLQQVQFSENMWPPCIRHPNTPMTHVTVIGWKSALSSEVMPFFQPQKANMKIMKPSDCEAELEGYADVQIPRKLDETLFCAKNETAGTCQGDSGSPLVVSDGRFIYVVGLTSFGFDPCSGKRAGVYVNVSHYVHWIECIVWSDYENIV